MYALVIIDINHKDVDRPFTYRIPDELFGRVVPGVRVNVPFGSSNHIRSGFCISLTDKSSLPDDRIKDIIGIDPKAVDIDDELIYLAIWLRNRYGGTLYQSLSVVLTGKMKVNVHKDRLVVFTGTQDQLEEHLFKARQKKHRARVRLLEAFQSNRVIPASIITERLNITNTSLKPYLDMGLVEIHYMENDKIGSVLSDEKRKQLMTEEKKELNQGQKLAVNRILSSPIPVSVLFGITGSGKTEVYLNLIRETVNNGKEVIVLIPEIALTYQTVMRFYERFGELISVVHSRLSKGEKYERFLKAKEGKIKIMIGPRSALFTPFSNLGMIIVDEFHETSYRSETVPKYDTVETAIERASFTNAKVVLGSATPSVEIYEKALSGEYNLIKLENRAVKSSVLPSVQVVDMREELKNKNRSVFSETLRNKIRDRLDKKEQVMLFLNRRGYSGAVSCRSCGEPITCPHCSVSLNYHRNGILMCHICGFTRPMVRSCPTCGSSLIGTFGTGTEKIEEMTKEIFPDARVLRMDADTTSSKNGHQEILEKFASHDADILIGTQMIVKGHDFKEVTLVGILAADLSLNVPDYRSAERTFQLLTQAEGRAGRDEIPGECIVQTYLPDHYAVKYAASQDFESFYREEMVFRKQMKYPPCGYLLTMMLSGAYPESVRKAMERITGRIMKEKPDSLYLGPVESSLFKVKDMFRYVFHIKTESLTKLMDIKNRLEEIGEEVLEGTKIYMSFDS